MPITPEEVDEALAISEEFPDDLEIVEGAASIVDQYEAETAQRQTATRTLFTNRETHGLPTETLQDISRTYDGDVNQKYRVFNDRYFRDFHGVPADKVPTLRDSLKKQYSLKEWGEEVVDDRAFADRLAAVFDDEDDLSKRGQQAALQGAAGWEADSLLDADAENPAFKGREKQRREYLKANYSALQAEIAPMEATINSFVEGLQVQMGARDGEARPDEDFMGALMDIPKEKRSLFLAAVAARGGEGQIKSLAQGMAERIGRGATDIVRQSNAAATMTKLDQLARHVVANGGVDALPAEFGFDPTTYLTGYLGSPEARDRAAKVMPPKPGTPEFEALEPEKQAALTRIEDERDFLMLYEQVNDIATGVVDPAEGKNWVQSGLLGVSSMVPNLALMAAGPVGAAVNIRGYQGQATMDYLRNNPGADTTAAARIGEATGIAQGLLDYIPTKIISGKVPMFSKWLEKATLTKGGLVGRAAVRFTGGAAFQLGQEFGQDVIVPSAVEEIAAVLKADLPGSNWDARLSAFTSDEALSEMIPSIIMLSLIGDGVGSVTDYKNGWELVGDRNLLIGAKLTEAEADSIIEAASTEDAAKTQTLLRDALARVDNEKGGVSRVRDDAAKQALTNILAESDKRIAAIEKGESSGIIPAVGRSKEGWTLRFQDGSTRTYGSHAEADGARWKYAEEKALTELDEFRGAVQTVERQIEAGREVVFSFSPERRTLRDAVQEGEVSRQGALNRAGIAEEIGGQQVKAEPETEIDPEQEYQDTFTASELQALAEDDKLALFEILGSNKTEFADGVQRTTVKLFRGATPLTVIEEKLEGDAALMLANNKRDWLLTRLRRYERASGDKLLPRLDSEVTDGHLKEAFSHLGQSYLVGRSRKSERQDMGFLGASGRKKAAKVFRSGLGSTMEGYRNFFRSVWKRAAKLNKLRREGKLDAELEQELARSVGYGEQAQYEASVQTEAEGFKTALEDMGFEAEPEGVTIAEATDDAPFSVIQKGEGYKKTVMPDGMTLEGPASFSVIAYHGTPHKVDKFMTEKIGTGEGAQAYGWGLYFAANKGVAQSYKEALSYNVATRAEEKRSISEARDVINLAKAHIQTAGSVVAAIPLIEKSIVATDGKSSDLNQKLKAAKAIITEENFSVPEKGNLYTVELLPDDEEFLDWDKPLVEQSDKIKSLLENEIEGDFHPENNGGWEMTGAEFHLEIEELAALLDGDESGGLNVGNKGMSIRVKRVSDILFAAGIKGIRYLDGNSRTDGTGTYNYVIFDDSLVRILEENGQPVTDEFSFSVITNATDSSYLSAVESGDMETAQRMVDEAAQKAGYASSWSLWHGTRKAGHTVFRPNFYGSSGGQNMGLGVYLTEDPVWAARFAGRLFSDPTSTTGTSKQGPWIVYEDGGGVARMYGPNVSRILDLVSDPRLRNDLRGAIEQKLGADPDNPVEISNKAKSLGYQGIASSEADRVQVVVFNPSDIKSADPVTRDESGQVIPLSQRFNPARDEITYSVITNADARIAEMFTPLYRNPEQRRKIVQRIQENVAVESQKFAAIARANRPNTDIERERKEIEGALFNEKLDTLSSGEIQALSNGNLLEDNSLQPILSKLLNEKTRTTKSGKKVRYWTGSLMSKSEAKRRGIDTNEGSWNGIPEGLPPFIWGGGMTPSTAADQFGFERPELFWDAIVGELQARSDRKREIEDANRRVRELEKEARTESRAWAEEQRKLRQTVGTDRATLVAAMRTLDAMISALPVEIRGKIGGFVRLAQFKTPGAMLDELGRRVNRLDTELERWLKKEADRGVKKLFETAKPAKDQAGKARKGKAGADIHDLFDTARQAWKNWTTEKAEGHALGIEAEIAKGEMKPEREAHALLEAELVRLFGGWNEADSIRKLHALETAEEIWREGYHAFKLKKAAETERRNEIREALRADTGSAGEAGARDIAEQQARKASGRTKEFFLSLLNFEQLTAWAFGRESKWAQWFADEQRKAENAKIDAVQSVTEGVENLFREMAGGDRFKGEALQFRMMEESISAAAEKGGTRQLSQLQGVSVMLMYAQEDGRKHMRGRRDESGELVSGWSYGDIFVESVASQMTPEAWKVLGYLQGEYGKEYEPLNAVYRDVYGVNLPKNPNYSPLTVTPQQASGGQTVDPVTGSTASTGSFTPGSLRNRAQTSAEPSFTDAVATFIAHKKQIEHWKAHARFVLDANAILGNREVGNSVEAVHGKEAVKVIRKWLDAIAQGGARDAGAGTAYMKLLGGLTGRAASMALVGRIGTLAVQSTQLAAAAATMPTGAYVSRLGKLLSGNLGWGAAFRSDYIQRRLKQQPVMVQQAMEGLRSGKPNQLKHQVRRIGQLLSGADALFTAGTFAMVHDYQFAQARKNGLDAAEAEAFAMQEAERVLESIAQPTRMGTRSFFEVSTTNPLTRMAWAFASDARKNAALLGYQFSTGSAADKYRATLFVIALNGLMAGVIRNAWRDMRDDEDEDVFDEKYWNVKRLILSSGTDWLFGFPVVGEEIQRALYSAAGVYQPGSGLLSGVADAPGAVERLATGEWENALRDVEKIATAVGYFNDDAAAITSLLHVVRDVFALGENLIPD